MKASARLAVGAALAGALAGIGLDRALVAQQAPVVRTPLLATADPGGDTHEVRLAEVTIAPGGATGRHRHPGVEIGYVIEGQIVIERANTDEELVEAGEAFTTDVVHNALNPGPAAARLVVAYVVEKGRPLAEAVQ